MQTIFVLKLKSPGMFKANLKQITFMRALFFFYLMSFIKDGHYVEYYQK